MDNQQKECVGRKSANDTAAATIYGVSVQLVFAAENNREIPAIVGRILKSAYLQRQSA